LVSNDLEDGGPTIRSLQQKRYTLPISGFNIPIESGLQRLANTLRPMGLAGLGEHTSSVLFRRGNAAVACGPLPLQVSVPSRVMSACRRKQTRWLRVQTFKVVVGQADRHCLAAPTKWSACPAIDRIGERTSVTNTKRNHPVRFHPRALAGLHEAINRTLAIRRRGDPA
jgi:hypothetical protein